MELNNYQTSKTFRTPGCSQSVHPDVQAMYTRVFVFRTPGCTKRFASSK